MTHERHETPKRQVLREETSPQISLRRRMRRSPWYNQGWVWLIVAAVILAVLVWQLSSLGSAVQSTAEATREQTQALREQTQAIRDQGNWIGEQLAGISQGLSALADRLDRVLRMAEEWLARN